MNPSSSNSASEVMDQQSSSIRPGPEISMRSMNLEGELICESVDGSLYRNRGVILQFVNHNHPDSATVIGGIRLKLEDIKRVPAYIAKYKPRIKAHAIDVLQRHLLDTQCPAGVSEDIAPDDYTLTFMVASLSEIGRRLHPTGRNEGPLFYCLFPALLDETYLYLEADGTPSTSYVINVYIHLNEASRRRTAVFKRNKEDAARRAEAAAAAAAAKADGPNNKKPRMGQPFFPGQGNNQILQAAMSTLAAEVGRLRSPYVEPPPTQGQAPAPVRAQADPAARVAPAPGPVDPYPAPRIQSPMIWPPPNHLPDLPED